MSTYGSHPEQMTVKLTLGDGAHLVATSANGWAGPVSLRWGPDDGEWTEETSTLTDPGTVDGTEVSWTLTVEQVTARSAFPYVRLVDNGMTMQAGEVIPWRGGLGSTTTQTIASLTAGPPGPSAVSADPDNVATISPNDGLIYVSPADAGGFSDAAVAAFVDDTGSSTYASILAGFAATDDPRLSDARTPTTHAASHASGGSDPVTPASIGAATPSQVSSGDSATLAAAQSHAQGLVDALTAASPATLDTLAEIAAALGEDPNFAATMTTALANRVRFDAAQSLTVPQQDQARTNIGAAPALGPDDNYVTDAEKAALHGHSNKAALDLVSGENTGDQDLSGYALTSSLGSAAAADTTDFAAAAQGIPAGGTDGQVLTKTSSTDYATAWETPSGGGGGGSVAMGPGLSVPSLSRWRLAGYVIGGFTDQALTATRVLMVPLDVDTDCAIDAYAVRVTTGASGSTIRLGLYAPTSDGAPGSLVAGTEQSVDSASTGIKEATFTKVNLSPGRYWIAYVGQDGTPTGRFYTSGLLIASSNNASLLPSGTATIVGYRGSSTASGALPSTISLATDNYNNAPLVAVRLVTQ